MGIGVPGSSGIGAGAVGSCPSGVGVAGESDSGLGADGQACSGAGVVGLSDSGVGVVAQSFAAPRLPHLKGSCVPGRLGLSTSGVAIIPARLTDRRIIPGVDVTSGSYLLLTPAAGIGRHLWYTLNRAANTITIRMSSAHQAHQGLLAPAGLSVRRQVRTVTMLGISVGSPARRCRSRSTARPLPKPQAVGRPGLAGAAAPR
jgi:hypothetical protein